MRNARSFSIVLLLTAATLTHAAPNQRFLTSHGKLPLSFEENRGQAPAGVTFLSRTRSSVVLLRPGSVSLQPNEGKAITMRFVGDATRNVPRGEDKLPGITSYLVGDETDWIRGIQNYESVRYPSVYPGIDAVFHGNQQRLEYDFVLSPGSDPGQIRIAFEGVDRIAVDVDGNLELTTPVGKMKHLKPKIWQTGEREVTGRYVVSGHSEVRFEVGRYDLESTLVIDPVVEYSTYFGSDRDDRMQAVATDSTGAVYMAGGTATAAVSWGFVTKVNPAGTAVLYTVFFGSGVCNAAARGIAVDSGNNAIVTGYYTQTDATGYCNIKKVLGAKVNPAGDAFVYQLVWGGNNDYGNAVAVDTTGNAYFTGSTRGSFPTTPGVIMPVGGFVGDAFITKLGPAGAPLYSTYLGNESMDEGLAIAVDAAGNAYVSGSTASNKFPTTTNAIQVTKQNTGVTGFVTKLNAAATQILYSTFLGGNSDEAIFGIAVDGQGKLHVSGNTTSPNFPTTTNAWDRTCGTDGACNPYNDGAWHNADDAFYSKIDLLQSGPAALVYSTFLGGTNRDLGKAVAIDNKGHAWITGTTFAGDFPRVQSTQATIGGNSDAFIAQVDPALSGAPSLLFATFLGGALSDEGTAVDIDPLGQVYVVGYTGSTNFPVVRALQASNVGGNEGFVVKLSAPASAVASVSLNPANLTGGTNSTATVTLTAAAPAGGAVVALTSSNTNAATVPASVTVAAGATSANFTITTKAVTTGTVVTITTSYNGVSKTAGLVVNPLLSSITLNPSVVTGGAGSTGTVTFFAPAPAGGAVVALSSSNVNTATVPASVTIAAGATTANFTLATKAVTTETAVNITATYNGASRVVTLVVKPPLTSVTANPVSVTGGATSNGTVTLATAAPAGGAVVALSSSNINAATVPASVTVTAGATAASFAIATKSVAAQTSVNINATYNGASKTLTFIVNPPEALATIALNPAAVTGGAASTGMVTLATAAPAGGAAVTLTSSNINAATVPASVTVTAGATTANFAVTSKAVAAVTAVTITGTYKAVAKTATLTVNPQAALAAMALNPAAVTGGATSTGTVTLATAAPAGGAVVALASGNINAATVPASVTVAAGATTANFAVTSKAVAAATAVTITGTYNAVAKTATLTVNPPAGLTAIALNPAAVTGGTASTGTVTLATAAPAGGAVVALASGNINAASVPASVTVAAGATTATFAVTGKAVTAVTAVTITATYNAVAKTATLTVNPPASLAGVSLNPATIMAGTATTGRVTLTSAAPAGGAVVALSTNEWATFYLPASVTVQAGTTFATFTVTSASWKATATITASYNGVNKAAVLTSVYPTVVGLTCAPNPVIAEGTAICTVTLNGVLPSATTVWILSDQPFFAPANGTVTVPAGAKSTNFSITTTLVPEPIVAHISASALATDTVTAPLTINLTNRGKKWVLNNVAIKGGGTATGYFTYDAATGKYLDVNIQVTPGPDPNNPLGHPPQNRYYYPWPNGSNATFVNTWSNASLLSVQNPIGTLDPQQAMAWTLLQLNFAQALTNAGGTVALVTNPNVGYDSFCAKTDPLSCTPPPGNISQERLGLAYPTFISSYFRVLVSGTVTAQ